MALPLSSWAQTACNGGNAGLGLCCKGCDVVGTPDIEGLSWIASNAGAPPGNTIGGPYLVGVEHGTVVYTDAPAVGIRQAELNPIWFALPSQAAQHIVSDLSAGISDELEILMTDAFAALNPVGPPCGDDTLGSLPLTGPVDYLEVYGAVAPNNGSRGAVIGDAANVYRVSGGQVRTFTRPPGAFLNATKSNITVTLNYVGGSVPVILELGCGGGFRSAVVPPMRATTPIAGAPVITCTPHEDGLLAPGPLNGLALRRWLDPRRVLSRALSLLSLGSRPAWAQAGGGRPVNVAGGLPPQGSSISPDGVVFLVLLMLAALGIHRLRMARA